MTYVLTLDEEQMDIVRESLRIPQAFLSARLKRVDPAGMLSKAYDVQAGKIVQILTNAWQGPLPTFDKLEPWERKAITELAGKIAAAEQEHTKAICLNQMVAILLSARRPEGEADLPKANFDPSPDDDKPTQEKAQNDE